MTRVLMSIVFLFCCSASVVTATNITASTNADRSEERIQVLRGMAEVLIRESRERITLREGEELIVRTGGRTEKTEIDMGGESKKWQQDLGKLGDSIQLREIQETLFQMRENETENFKKLQDTFKTLLNKESVTDVEEMELRKTSERLAGVLSEDALIMNAIQQKLEKTLSDPNTSPSDKSLVAGYMKMLAAAKAGSQGFQSEISKILKAEFRAPTLSISAEVEALNAELEKLTESLDQMRAIAGTPGQSQEVYAEAQNEVSKILKAVSESLASANVILEKNPADAEVLALIKKMQGQQNQLPSLLRSLSVVAIPAETITGMRDSEEGLADRIHRLQDLMVAKAKSGMSAEEIERDPQVMSEFSKVRLLYMGAQRLYESTMRGAGRGTTTQESEEIQATWERISDSYQRVSSAAGKLEMNLNTIMGIISGYAKDGDTIHLSNEQKEELNKVLIAAGYSVAGGTWDIDGYADGEIKGLIFTRIEVAHLNDVALPGTPPQTSQPTVTPLGNYSHLSWGEWSSQTTVPDLVDFTETHWISGSLTPGLNIPIQGGASYNGQVLGTLNESGVISRISGSSNLFADFSTRSLSGTFDMVRNNGSNWTGANLNAAWAAGNNNISGTLSSNNGMSGTVNGNFFGPAAEQVGGKWNMQDNNNQATGIFVATQPQSN